MGREIKVTEGLFSHFFHLTITPRISLHHYTTPSSPQHLNHLLCQHTYHHTITTSSHIYFTTPTVTPELTTHSSSRSILITVVEAVIIAVAQKALADAA